MIKNYGDLALFGKVISTAFLMIGYILLGFFLGRKLVEYGYPSWTQVLLPFLGALLGIHQGYYVMKEIIKKIIK